LTKLKLRTAVVALIVAATPAPASANWTPFNWNWRWFLTPSNSHYRTAVTITKASFYGGGPKRYEPNSHTANGELFDQWAMTAAHRTIPFNTRLRVTYRNRSVIVRVNDRGPAAWTGRGLDVSRGAATRLGLIGAGTGIVRMEVLR
jgi:rare lipoprotein A (peptidoglycan hydrolase)